MTRDRKWLDYVRTCRCFVSGKRGNDRETVDPAHIGRGGMGIKCADDEVIPLLHSIHAESHQHGLAITLRNHGCHWTIPDLIDHARKEYQKWKDGKEPFKWQI